MNEPNPPLPSAPGAYALLIALEQSTTIEVGRLGALEFPPGFYAYVGSALGGLVARVNRHLRSNKKLHWHVDYLLEAARLSQVIWAVSKEKLECSIADSLGNHGFNAVSKFGASDCRCPSHLFHSPTRKPLHAEIIRAFTTLSRNPHLYQPSSSFLSS